MPNPLLGQILGGVFAHAMQKRGMRTGGGAAGGLGGVAMGSVLGGMLGRGGMARGGLGGGRGALVAMMLPFAMRWVQKNGGLQGVLERFRQKGYGTQAQSWVNTGANQDVAPAVVEDVVGRGELEQIAQKLGVPERDVADAFAEIFPEMVDKLTPDGSVPAQADALLQDGADEIEEEIGKAQREGVS
jgi:uncharacterized protein YidB (DUF937 family)